MSFQIKAEVLLNNSNWEKNLRKTSKQMEGFGKSMKTISNGVKAAWAGVAALGVGMLFDAIVDVTKAAAQDAKSQALLNAQLQRNWHTNQAGTKAIEDQIDALSNMSGIADDTLRPALQKIVAVTKNSSKGMKAFQLAMDISAGTGKDLNVVSQAMAKYLGGNKKALDKLVPGLSTATDKMKFLKDQYGGMAAIAGNNDPFSRINVVMDNFKEKLGTAFLPVVQKFSDWLASPDAQKSLDDIAKKVQKFGEWFASPEGQKAFKGWMKDLKTMIKLAGDFLGLVSQVATLLGSSGENRLKNKAPIVMPGTGRTVPIVAPDDKSKWTDVGNQFRDVVMNVTVNGVASGQDVVTALTSYARGKGIPMSRLLG